MSRRRIFLKRQDAPVLAWTYLIGGLLVFLGIIYLLVIGLGELDAGEVLFSVAVAGVSIAVVFSTARLLRRRIVFLDNYISFRFWPGTPRVYRYEDVIDIRTVKVEPVFGSDWGVLDRLQRWEFEENTTIYFADGDKLRIPSSAMSASKVKRRIESKLGIKFDSYLKLPTPKNARNKNTVASSRRRPRSKKRGTDKRDSPKE